MNPLHTDELSAVQRSQKHPASARRRSRAGISRLNRKRSSRSLQDVLPSVEQIGVGKEKSLSPLTDDSGSLSTANSLSAGLKQSEKSSSVSTTASQEAAVLWSHLPSDLQYHLEFHQQLTYHHWFFKHDAPYFIYTIMIEHALTYDPLYVHFGVSSCNAAITLPFCLLSSRSCSLSNWRT